MNTLSRTVTQFYFFLFSILAFAQPPGWQHISTEGGNIPKPWDSPQQTASLVVDLNNDKVNDWVVGCRVQPPTLVWYARTRDSWQRYVIENEYVPIEAGGAFYDIDGDGDQDLVFGNDWQGTELYWWENPYPKLETNTPWKRYTIKKGGKTQHHDQIFGDFKRTGKPQLVYWNQGSKTLYLTEIPANPKETADWKAEIVYQGSAGEQNAPYAEGLAAGDLDGDGSTDLIAGNYWFKYQADGTFKPIRVAEMGGRVALGRFKPGKTLQLVVASGDGEGPLTLYECQGNPEDPKSWVGKDIGGRSYLHAHTLEVADVNGDGNLDIFTAEMAKWSEKKTEPDNPNAEALLFYGDGKGNFRKELFLKGWGFHEARLADLNGDGTVDILSKPYNWKTPRMDIWLQKKKKQGRSGK